MSDEDQIASALIEQYAAQDSYQVLTEVHYNHYGSRGVVDVVLTYDRPLPDQDEIQQKSEALGIPESALMRSMSGQDIHIIELKSRSAVESATGANEIIRQFNRHHNYFFDGTDYNVEDFGDIKWYLDFSFCEGCYSHVNQNSELYSNLDGDGSKNVGWRHPDSGSRARAFVDGEIRGYSEIESLFSKLE